MRATNSLPAILTLVTGASSDIGTAFLRALSANTTCIGISRQPPLTAIPSTVFVSLDLMDKKATRDFFSDVDVDSFNQIVWIHSVGKFRFEPKGVPPERDMDGDGVDDEVFHANVSTFINVIEPLSKRIRQGRKKKTLHFCLFGSMSSDFPTPFWPSFTKSKNQLSTVAQMEMARHSDMEVFGIMVKLSTVKSNHVSCARSLQDMQNWLTPEEVVQKTIPHLLNPQMHWRELNVFKFNPHFDPSWYWNPEKVRERWSVERKR